MDVYRLCLSFNLTVHDYICCIRAREVRRAEFELVVRVYVVVLPFRRYRLHMRYKEMIIYQIICK